MDIGDVLQGEQARGISSAAEDLATRFGKQTNGNTYKVGIARVLPDNSKIAISRETQEDASTSPVVTVSRSVFVKDSEAEVAAADRSKRKEHRQERAVTKIVFSDGQIITYRKGIDIVDDAGCSEPKKKSERPLSGVDLDAMRQAIASLSEALTAENNVQPPPAQPKFTRRLFQAVRKLRLP